MSRSIRSFQDIIAWLKAMSLAEVVHVETRQLPLEERFGLQSQMRRAAYSIPSSIAEGWGRGRSAECTRLLAIARGSLFELTTQTQLCERIGFEGDWRRILSQAEEVRRVLHGFIQSCPQPRH